MPPPKLKRELGTHLLCVRPLLACDLTPQLNHLGVSLTFRLISNHPAQDNKSIMPEQSSNVVHYVNLR